VTDEMATTPASLAPPTPPAPGTPSTAVAELQWVVTASGLLSGHAAPICSLATHPAADLIATADAAGGVRIWRCQPLLSLHNFRSNGSPAAVAWLSSGTGGGGSGWRLLASAGAGGMHVLAVVAADRQTDHQAVRVASGEVPPGAWDVRGLWQVEGKDCGNAAIREHFLAGWMASCSDGDALAVWRVSVSVRSLPCQRALQPQAIASVGGNWADAAHQLRRHSLQRKQP
jgi:hypothetical protein